jgi:hypothetical protein
MQTFSIFQDCMARRFWSLALIAASLAIAMSISPQPASAQACTNCKIPSGYTPLKGDSSGSCVNKAVDCTCDGVKSKQPMCLYHVQAGGNLKAVGTVSQPGK